MDVPPPVPVQGPPTALRRHLSDPLYRTSYLLIMGSGVTAVVGLVFWVAAARSYPAHIVGLSSALISATVLVSSVCQLGLGPMLVRYLPATGHRTRNVVIRAYALTVVLSVILGAAAALASPLWSSSLSFLAHSTGWTVGFTATTACWTVFSLQDFVMTGLQAPQWVPLENSIYSVAKLILLVALSAVIPFSGPFVAWNVPAGLAVLAITLLVFRRLIPRRRRLPSASRVSARQFARTAAGNYGASLFSIGVVYLTPVLVTNITNPTQTAYFYAAWTMIAGIQIISVNTTTSMTVEAALNEAQLADLFRRSLVQVMRLLLPIAAVVITAAPLILSIFGHRYAHAATALLRLLTVGALANAVVTLGLGVGRIQQRGLLLLVTQAAEFIPLTVLVVVLVPSHGIVGVGIAYLASQSTVALGLLATNLRPLLTRHLAGKPR
jgi:O-antigen/teichoic acid export membrane protein